MRKIIALCLGILMAVGFVAVPAQKAAAADATTVFIELTGTTSEIFSTTYLRGRVLALDANGELATTFGGAAIADATLELQAVSATSYAQWSTEGVNDLDPSFDYTGSEKATIGLDAAYQEFAVRFYNPSTGAVPDSIGAEIIRATIKKGTSSISADANITILAPEANCFVVRTGSLATLPDVLDEITVRQNNGGGTNSAGQSVTINVFAAKYYGGKYYFTSNVPTGATGITVLGVYVKSTLTGSFANPQTYASNVAMVQALTDPSRMSSVQVGMAMVSLVDGYASSSVAIENLQIPGILAIEGLLGSGTTGSASASTMSTLLDGYDVYWYPVPTTTRKIGNKSGDVTSGDMLNISSTTIIGLMDTAAYNDFDKSAIKPADTTKISIIGLPVNEVDGSGNYLEAGIGGAEMAAGTLDINPLDAYYLLEDWKTKPSSVKVAAKQNSNFIYGAIVARDTYGNPAPFYAAAEKIRFELKKTSSATAINSATAELRPANGSSWAADGWSIAGAITSTANYQAFLPFMITATAASGSASVDDLYISAVKRPGSSYALLSSSLTADIDTYSEGVDFVGQQYVGAITPTSNFDTAFAGKEAAEEGEFQVMGTTNEKSFDMRGVTIKGKTVKLGAKGISSASAAVTSITLPTDTGNLAKKDVAVCTALGKNQKTYLMFKGTSNGTLAVIPVTLTTSSMTAADPGDFGISLIMPNPLSSAKVYLDDEGDHQTAVIGSGNFLIYDGFSNKFGCVAYSSMYTCADTTYLTIEDSDVEGTVYTLDADNVPTTTVFSGASADVNANTVEVEFDLPDITADQSGFGVTLATESGSPSGTINIYTQALQSLVLDNIYVPVEGINNTPVMAYFADQAGAKVMPVTTTAVTYGAKGSRLEVELEANPEDNGTITAGATEYVYTADSTVTNYDNTVRFTARINSGFESMAIEGGSDYGDQTLTLTYNADFEKPVIVDPLVAIDCGFEITITDNIDVDAAATQVTVKNASGEDITSTLLQSVASDNGTSAVIQIKGTGTGSFTVSIVAKDASGNEQTGSKIVSVTTATDCAISAACLSVSPAYVSYGDAATDITISGQNTNFVQGTTAVDFSCAAVTEGAVTVNSASELTVSVTVPETGETEDCDITVTTGDETITCADLFQVVAGVPCTDADGDGYGEGCTAGTDCDDNNSAVNPGAAEVCDDSIDNDCDGAIDDADTDCEVEPTCTITLSKTSARAGFILPRLLVLSITGSGDDFSTSASVSFSAGVTKLLQIPGSGKITVIGLIKASAKGSTVTVSVAGCDGTADLTIN